MNFFLTCWQFDIKGDIVQGAWIVALAEKDGEPIQDPKWVLDWLTKSMAKHLVPGSVTQIQQCCFCWRGVVDGYKAPHHTTAKCPLLALFNSTRGSARLSPITVLRNSFSAPLTKQPMLVEQLVKEVQKNRKDLVAQLGALEKCMTAVESKKWKLDSAGSARVAKKKKKGGQQPAQSAGLAVTSVVLP